MPIRVRLAFFLCFVFVLGAHLYSGGEMNIVSRWFSLRRGNPEQQFWQWFTTHAAQLKALDPEDHEHPLIADLERELTRVQPGLTWERDVKQNELVISADGNRKLFPAVQKLVAAAPTIPGWRIVAFRQPCQSDFTLQYSNYTVRSQDVRFHVEADGTKVGITLFMPHPSGVDRQAIGSAAFLLLDAALGEYDVETKVGSVEWRAVPEESGARGLLTYRELPAAVSHLYQRLQSN